MPEVDPLAALKCWSIKVHVGEYVFTIPPVPAAAWFVAILGEEPLPILSLLPEAEQQQLDDAFAEGEIGFDELVEAQRDALEIASGWRWWSADLMIRSAGAQWRQVGGAMARRGIDPGVLPLGAVLNALYALATEGRDQNETLKFDMDLDRPPADLGEEEREQLAEDMFAAALAEAGVPPSPPTR